MKALRLRLVNQIKVIAISETLLPNQMQGIMKVAKKSTTYLT